VGLTVTAAARSLRLAHPARLRGELGLASSDDAALAVLIDRASDAIVDLCRPFARQTYVETVAGYGSIHLQLARAPVVAVASVLAGGLAITDYEVQFRDRAWLYRERGWDWTVQSAPGLTGWQRDPGPGSPVPRSEVPHFTVTYTAGYVLPGQYLVDVATVSAAAADNSFNDSASGFPSSLVAGDTVSASGFTSGANNGRFVIVSATAAKIVVSGALLTTEAAAASRSLSFGPSAECRSPGGIEQAAMLTAKAWYLSLGDDPRAIEKALGSARVRLAEGQQSGALPLEALALLRPWASRPPA
jgi:hypothetical protein